MPADMELGVMLEPTNDLEEEVGDVQANVSGGGGGNLTAGQRDQQQSVVAGGVSKGLAGAAVLGAILSQLKAITAPIKAVLGAISRGLIPVVEKVADFIRPLIQDVNELTSLGPEQFIQKEGREGAQESQVPIIGRENVIGAGPNQTAFQGGEKIQTENGTVPVKTPQSAFQNFSQLSLSEQLGAYVDFLTDPSRTADQTGEQSKQQMKDRAEDAKNDKLGGFN